MRAIPVRRPKISRSPEYAFSPMSPEEDTSPLFSSGGGDGESEYSSGAPDIAPHEIKKGKPLGKGSFAQVFAGMCRGLPVAVKVLNDAPDKLTSEHGLRKFREEIAVHQRLYHPNVVLLMGACVTGDKLMIVQELMHKDLERILFDQNIKLSLARRVEFGRQIALGMNWLHKLDPPVLHRDLKPSNCLVDREMVHLKIADFGLASIMERGKMKESQGPRGTANYLAPEVLAGESPTMAADVYAFGILLWQILTRKRPYEDLGSISMEGFTDMIVDEDSRPEIDGEAKKDYPILTDLIERCWHPDPELRPQFEEIVDILTDALVEIAIPHDVEAQRFWIKFFQHAGPEGVKIDRCIKALLKWFRLPSNPEMRPHALQAQINQLEILLHEKEDHSDSEVPNNKMRITAEWFGSLMNWVGPFDHDFLKRVGNLCSKPWFHGNLSGPQATRLLNGRADGFYLVRFSATEPGYFTISKIQHGKVTHIRIIHQPCSSHYTVGTPSATRDVFKSLSELLEKERTFLEITQACPGSRFSPVQEISGYLSTGFSVEEQ